jgi:type IV secretion system protein VirB11
MIDSIFSENTEELFGEYLKDNTIKEICVNPDGALWVETINDKWIKKGTIENDIKKLGSLLQSFATTAANYNNTKLDETNPFLSGTLETGERIQLVFAPASKNLVVDIRKNHKTNVPYQKYLEQGLFNNIRAFGDKNDDDIELNELYKSRDFFNFIKKAVEVGKNIIFCGETGSGKTTFMKSLMEFIPENARLISIEDTEELAFFKHENYIQLFYDSQYKESDPVTPSSLLKACLRLKPTRILLAEIRDQVALDFIKVIGSGHNGTMCSYHSPTVEMTFQKLVTNVMENPKAVGLSDKTVASMIGLSIDIIIQMSAFSGSRKITEVYFKDVDYEKLFN